MTDSPLKLKLTPKVVKYSKKPLIITMLIAALSLIFVIFSTHYKQVKRQQEAKMSEAENEVAIIEAGRKRPHWFEDAQYQNSTLEPVGSPAPEEERIDAVNPSALPSLSSEVVRTDNVGAGLVEERKRAETELARLKEYERVDIERARADAYKSPIKIGNIQPNRLSARSEPEAPALQGQGRNVASPSYVSALAGLRGEDDQNRQEQKKAFIDAEIGHEDYLDRQKEAPLSPYEVKAGSVIPAVLITGLDSDLPGSVIAQVRENVYDTATGNYLLIPQGTRLVGEYDSSVSFGQKRALVIWSRLIYPDGASINIQNMQGVDVSGYAGFRDKVDNHYLKIYGNALLLSLVGAGYQMLEGGTTSTNQNDPKATLAAAVGQQLAQTTAELGQKHMNVQPTIKIRPGYTFNVLIMKDLILEPL